MAYLLQFPAATAYVNTGRLIFGAGYSVTFDIQRDSDVNIYLSSDTGDELRYIVGTGWQIRISNVYYTYNEPELTPPIGSRFTVTFSRNGSTSTRGVSLNSGTVYTRTTGTGNLWVNNLGQGAGGAYQAFKLYKCTFTQPVDAGGYNRVFDPDASGGSGSLLINTLTNTNNGALTGAGWSIPACWVFYSSGATAYADALLAGSYAHSGSLLNSSVGYSSALQAGSFTHSGSQLSSSVARSSVLLAGSYAHSGSALGSAVGYSSALQGGAFSYSGNELQSIISNGAQNYSDTLLGGSFTHSGSTLQSAIARNSTLLAGSYSHSGSSLSASLAFYSTLNGGAYSHFGSMLQSTVSGQVTVSIEGYTITFAADDVSGAFAADMVGGSYQSDYIEAIKWLI